MTQEEKERISQTEADTLDPSVELQTQNKQVGLFLVATAVIVGTLLVMQGVGTPPRRPAAHQTMVVVAAPPAMTAPVSAPPISTPDMMPLPTQTQPETPQHQTIPEAPTTKQPETPQPQPDPVPAPKTMDPIAPDVLANAQNLVVTNKDDFAYHNVEIKLNLGEGQSEQGYVLYPGTIEPGETQTLSLSDFADSDGAHFDPESMKLRTAVLTCDTPQGSKMGSWSGDLSDSHD